MKSTIRSIPLDGARLWFDRASGLNVRLDSMATHGLEQLAPRTVLFGITNACPLTCSFCSRDLKTPSLWTAESAFAALKDFDACGVLEVAFGGGEPLAFRGLDALLQRLRSETALALNVTTNGTLVTPERAVSLAATVAEVRVSLYEDNPWRRALTTLAGAGIRTGANIIVERERLADLPTQLAELPSLGCQDVALLRYVGPDASRELGVSEVKTLSAIVRDAPVRVRLSTCFSNALPDVPRLFSSGDCGAGTDFITITPDQKLKACSFHGDAMPFESAQQAIALWRERRARLSKRAPFVGCARPVAQRLPLEPGLRVWQGFSANNSGDCVLVGRFDAQSVARDFVERLRGLQPPGEAYSPALLSLLDAEGITAEAGECSPEAMNASGRSVVFHTQSAPGDDFPSLRTLLWRSGGVAVLNSIHEHEALTLVEALGFDDDAQLEAVCARFDPPLDRLVRRGLTVFVASPWRQAGAFPIRDAPRAAAELVVGSTEVIEQGLLKTVAQPAPDGSRQWVFASFRDPVPASFRSLGGVIAGRYALFEVADGGAHAGTKAQRAGGLATFIGSAGVRFEALFWSPTRSNVDQLALQSDLRVELGPDAAVELPHVDTSHPDRVLRPLVEFAEGRGLSLWLMAGPLRPLAATVARLEADVSSR